MNEYESGLFFDKVKELMYIVQNEIALNEDLREKCVGDKVIIWDGSSLSYLDGKKKSVIEFDDYKNKKFIVFETGCYYTEEDALLDSLNIMDSWRIQDLVVVDQHTNKKYRTSSKHVKLAER